MLQAPPVRVRKDEKNQDIPPADVEKWFYFHGYTMNIEHDYLEKYYMMMQRIDEWCLKHPSNDYVEADFDCSIMRCSLAKYSGQLWLNLIYTRSCAQGWGFYRYLLWRLRCCVLEHGLNGLYVFQVLSYNAGLLERLGFQRMSPDDIEVNYKMMKGELRLVRAEDWRVPAKFPSADKLNRPEDVNGGRELSARLKGLYL